jgi:chromosome partitioning protein
LTTKKTPVVMLMNMKGGVGKTTLSTHLAWGLSWHYDAKVLLIDYDHQCNTSLALLQPRNYFALKEDGKSLGPVLMPSSQKLDPFTSDKNSHLKRIESSFYTHRIRNWSYTDGKPGGHFDLIPGDLDLLRISLTAFPENTEQKMLKR